MASKKRMNAYLVTVRWYYKSHTKGHFDRKIMEYGLTAQSAKKKVMAHYSRASMIKKLGKPIFISVVSYWGAR